MVAVEGANETEKGAEQMICPRVIQNRANAPELAEKFCQWVLPVGFVSRWR
jgi:hypothetical protein